MNEFRPGLAHVNHNRREYQAWSEPPKMRAPNPRVNHHVGEHQIARVKPGIVVSNGDGPRLVHCPRTSPSRPYILQPTAPVTAGWRSPPL
jgi:hypothetical protein